MKSIRLLFPLIFALQLFVAVGLSGAIAYFSQTREARETATEFLDLIGNNMDEKLFQFIWTPVSLTELVADELRRHPEIRVDDLLSHAQVDRVTRTIWVPSGLSRWVNLTLANSAGQNVRIDRREYGKQIIKTSDIRKGGEVSWRLLEKRHADEKPIEVQEIKYDPRQSPYFSEATRQKKLVFTPVYFNPLVRNAPVVTVAEPVFDERGHLRVVISSDIYLQGISAYLRGMRLPKYSVAFIFDNSGHIIASSSLETTSNGNNAPQPVLRLVSLVESTNPVIRATAAHLAARGGGFAMREPISFQYMSDDRHRYVYAARLFREFELDWNLAVVIAEDGLIQNLVNGIRWTAWASVLLLALAVIVGLATAAWMIRPILTLRAVASALEFEDLDDDHLRLRQLEQDARRRDEFGALARTFFSMIREVRMRHDLLESQLEQLRVGIDHNEAARQVAEIASTDFFRSLKAKARALRNTGRQNQATTPSS